LPVIRVGIPVLAGFLAGCGVSPIGVSDESGTGSGGSSGASPTSTGASLSTGSSSTGRADASSGSSSSSSTTAELDGPGCGEPPACEGAVLEGSVRIESSADLAQFEGISVVTGFVESITGAADRATSTGALDSGSTSTGPADDDTALRPRRAS